MAILFGERWRVDELKDLIQHFTAAVTNRMDDHDVLIEVRTMLLNTSQQVNSLVAEIPKRYVTADQFEPIRKIVYGMVSLILGAVVAAILFLVIRR